MSKEYKTKITADMNEYPTGARRGNREGKGRYDLLPPTAIKRLADIFERGATAHGDRNYEKGYPFSRLVESALRHTFQYLEGRQDEDHLGQACWNLMALIHIETLVERGILPKELNDLPSYKPEGEDDKDWRK